MTNLILLRRIHGMVDPDLSPLELSQLKVGLARTVRRGIHVREIREQVDQLYEVNRQIAALPPDDGGEPAADCSEPTLADLRQLIRESKSVEATTGPPRKQKPRRRVASSQRGLSSLGRDGRFSEAQDRTDLPKILIDEQPGFFTGCFRAPRWWH